jgi:NAD(P)-dependent dehydrogenase (short-subunit alcohol dehydrogenase family)
MRLESKVALISGGARGIGAATARLFAREGAAVIIGDVLTQQGEQTAAAVRHEGGRARFVHLDVTSAQSWQEAVAFTVEHFGRLDILVNNAGIQVSRPSFFEVTEADWGKIMAVNATGVFLGAKAVAPVMRDRRAGSIVNISSISGITGGSASAGYAASKGAVRVFTKYLAVQLAPYNVRANSVHPGGVWSDLTAPGLSDPAAMARSVAEHPIGRIGQPEDIALANLYLASDEASWVTGAELVIDGGFTAK